MSNTSPTWGRAFADLAAKINGIGEQWRRATRYLAADRYRARLIRDGEYIRTSEQRPICLVQFISKPLPEYKPEPWPNKGTFAPVKYVRARPTCNLHWPGCGCQMEPMNPIAELDALTCHCGRIACRHHQEES